MKFFDFGAFQKIKKMVSREKILFHMLFGASHGTHRNKLQLVLKYIPRKKLKSRHLNIKLDIRKKHQIMIQTFISYEIAVN